APLREVVGADALAALTGAHLAPAVRRDGRRLLLLRALEQAGLQPPQGLRPVLDLRALVLAGDHQPGGQMGQPHRGVGGVDTLAARTGGAIDVDLDILLVHLDVDVLGFREHRHRHGGGVDAPARLGGGHALDAVHTALELEPAPGPAPLHQRHDFLEPAYPGGMAVHDLPLPALALRVLGVHAEQLGREEAGLVAARAGADLEEDVLLVVGIPRDEQAPQLLLERALPGGQLVDLGLGQLAHLAVGVLGEDVAGPRGAGGDAPVLLYLCFALLP